MNSVLALALLGCLHLGTFFIVTLGVMMAMQRERLYAFLFAALMFYQVLGALGLSALVLEFGVDAVFSAELVALGASVLLVSSLWLAERSTILQSSRRSDDAVNVVRSNPRPYLMAAGACMVLAIVLLVRSGFEFVELTWQQARLNAAFLDVLATFLQFMAFPAVWIAYRAGLRIVALILLCGALSLFIVYGSRAALLTLPAAAALDLYLRRRESRATVPVIAALAAGALLLHVTTRFLRGFGLAGVISLLRGESLSGTELLDILAATDFSGGEAAIYRYFVFVVGDTAASKIHSLTSVARWLMLYVPSGLVPGLKPSDVTYELWWHGFNAGIFDHFESFPQVLQVISAGGGGSLHPLLWGEIWANGGMVVWPIVFAVLIGLICTIEIAYSRMPPMMYVLSAPATIVGYLMIARGNSVIGIGYFAYIVPMAAFLFAISFAASRGAEYLSARHSNCD